jgi:hypothetical protein
MELLHPSETPYSSISHKPGWQGQGSSASHYQANGMQEGMGRGFAAHHGAGRGYNGNGGNESLYGSGSGSGGRVVMAGQRWQ